MKTGKIRITDLCAKTIIGVNDRERKKKQPVLINIEILYNAQMAAAGDRIQDALDYDTLSKKIVAHVEKSRFFLLEKLTDFILNLVMQDKKILSATVRVDKPGALISSRSVSFELSACKTP